MENKPKVKHEWHAQQEKILKNGLKLVAPTVTFMIDLMPYTHKRIYILLYQ